MGNKGHGKRGCYSVAANRQFDYDHRNDNAWYLDKAFVERRLEVPREAYEQYKDLAAVYGGPAVQEVFGEEPFAPVQKKKLLIMMKNSKSCLCTMQTSPGRLQTSISKGKNAVLRLLLIRYLRSVRIMNRFLRKLSGLIRWIICFTGTCSSD